MGRALADAVPQAAVAYVITAAPGGGAHVAPVAAVVDDRSGTVSVSGLGRRTRANLDAGSPLTLLWSPGDPGAHSLILDGAADLGGDRCVVRPTRAVLHRPGDTPGDDDGGACAADCVEVPLG